MLSRLEIFVLESGQSTVRAELRQDEVYVVEQFLIAFRHQHAARVFDERFCDQRRREFRIDFHIADRLDARRDHNVGGSVGNQLRNFGVLVMDDQLSVFDVGAREFLIDAARIDHHFDIGAIDIGKALKLFGVGPIEP